MNSISSKLAVIYLSIAMVVAVLQSLINITGDLDRTKLEIRNHIASILDTAASPASQAIFDMNQINAQRILHGLHTYPFIIEGVIIDELGLEFEKFSKPRYIDSHSVWISRRIFGKVTESYSKELYNDEYKKEMGVLVLVIDYDIALAPFYSRMNTMLVSSFIRTLVIFSVLFYITHTYITKPIIELAGSLRHQSENGQVKLNTPAEHRKSEIGILVNEFNHSFKLLSDTKKELRELNAELETRVKLRTEELEKANQHLEILATKDPLTNVNNRRHFFSRASNKYKLFKRYHRPLSILMLDIDDFKSINDNFGHKVGDEAIVSCANCCLSCLRETDILGRIGGEEFAIVLPESNKNDAFKIAERIRNKIMKCDVLLGYNISMTVSIGLCTLTEDIESISDAIDLADKALYVAKNSGKNRVEISQ